MTRGAWQRFCSREAFARDPQQQLGLLPINARSITPSIWQPARANTHPRGSRLAGPSRQRAVSIADLASASPLCPTLTRSKHGRSPDHKKSGAAGRNNNSRAASSFPAPAAAAQHGFNNNGSSSSSYACPSFAAAPKPEALPMPTSSLITRALLARRSPSPPKMPSAPQAVVA